MKVSELIKAINLELLTDSTFADKEINGVYIGDLLSWVMGRAKPGDAWITIMSNINIVAVASLTEAACIVLCEGVKPEESVIEKANMQNVIILSSEKTSYQLAIELSNLLKV